MGPLPRRAQAVNAASFCLFFSCNFFLVYLYQLTYESQAMGNFGAHELAALPHRGQEHNQAHGISGVLPHAAEGRFLQVLEGPKTAVRHLYYHVVLSDTRHFQCQVMGEEPCAQRSFAGWTMGCRAAALRALPPRLAAGPARSLRGGKKY